jgi:hypothetical protein
LPIENDADLVAAVERASRLIQDIQDYTKRTLRNDALINFPRGVLRTAEHYRTRCPDYLTPRQKASCAYGFMYLDVLWWILSRTNLDGIAKEMVFKSAIITQGTILEAMLYIPNQGIFSPNSNAGVKARLDRAVARRWISWDDGEVLKELWTNRCNVHLKLLDSHEFGKYTPHHVNQPRAALDRLINALRFVL